MEKFNFQNRGQGLIGIIIILAIVALIGGGAYYYFSRELQKVPEIPQKSAEEITKPKEITPPKEEILEEKTTPKKEEKPIVQKCVDGTPYGECSINKPKYCDNGNLIDKASLCGCPTGYKISDNQCIAEIPCQNECAQIGLKGCLNEGYKICGNYDADNCLEWGQIVSCPVGMSCVMGNCVAIVPPKNNIKYWAVIVGTSGNGEKIEAFNYLPLVLKDILIAHGWKEEYIKYFVGENATYINVTAALDWLANNASANDIILFYSISHGASNGISLSDEFLGFSELAEKLNKIKYKGMVIIIDACYSGAAIPILKKENRIIITSTRSNEMGINEVFSQMLLSALQGFGDIEGNNNGWVSAEEAFNFVQKRYSGPQSRPWPQIQDDYPGELNILFLGEYWRYLDQFNIEKGTHSFTGLSYLGGNPLEGEIKIYAQSFKPNYPILTKVMLGINFGGGKPGPITVSIRKDLSGPDLTSATLEQDVIRPFSSQLYEFDFPDIEVIPNETYYLVISISSAVTKNDYYNLWVDTSGSYPEGSYPKGTAFFKGIRPLTPWTDISPVDLYFATFGKPK
jgi:hypothetical protein